MSIYRSKMTLQHFTPIYLKIVLGFKTQVENLYLAGDWVKLDCPAMLMEAATTSALYCTNNILSSEGLKQEPIFSVPLKGIFA